jgi:hypothetical protein
MADPWAERGRLPLLTTHGGIAEIFRGDGQTDAVVPPAMSS